MYGLLALMPQKKNGGLCYLDGSHVLGTINHEMSFMKGSSQKN